MNIRTTRHNLWAASLGKRLKRVRQGTLREEGSTLVEFGLACTILMLMMFGIFQLSMGLYTYHFLSDMARRGTRYAIVRGSVSCTNTPNLTNCGATPAQIQTYLQGLGYPGINSSSLNAATTWYSWNGTAWSLCTTAPCNVPGNAARVAVTYAYPLNIPFLKSLTLNLSSTSQMIVSQ